MSNCLHIFQSGSAENLCCDKNLNTFYHFWLTNYEITFVRCKARSNACKLKVFSKQNGNILVWDGKDGVGLL